MLELLVGVAAGFAGGYVVKGQTSKSENASSSGTPYSVLWNEAQSEISQLKTELRTRDSEIDDLNQRIKSLTKKIRANEDNADDSQDEIDDMKRTIESLRSKNADLSDKVDEYKSLYTAAKQEIERLKG